MTLEETTNITDFPLADEIKQLGISRIYTRVSDTNTESILFVELTGNENNPLQCRYNKNNFKNTTKELESVLTTSGLDHKTAKKFIILLTKLCIEMERQKQKTQRDQILEEIRKRRKNSNYTSVEEWQHLIEDKYHDLRETVNNNVPELWPGLEFELSVLRILNILDCNLPFIGLLLGRPSSYKTQTLSLLRDWYCIYYTDDFTAKSFVSHSTSVPKEELAEIDMLPRIKNRLFLTPELAPMFTVKDEDLNKMLGIITRIADGQGFKSNSGAHGQRGYDENIMFAWIGAVVDIPYKVYKMLGNLGFKLYFFRIPYTEKSEEELVVEMSHDFPSRIKSITPILNEYLYIFETGPHLIYDNELNKVKWNTSKDDIEAKKCIARLGKLLGHLRCIAKTWNTEGTQGSEYGYAVSQPEDPRRAITVLQNLARGHALLTGRNYITLEDIPIVAKTVLSTAQTERVSVFYLLLDNGGDVSTDDIMRYLGVSKPTAGRTMAELKVIGLVEEYEYKEQSDTQFTKHIRLKDDFEWFLSEDFKKLREGFEPIGYKKTNKEKIPPYTLNESSIVPSADQLSTFSSIFYTLEKEQENSPSEVDRGTVSGEVLRRRLVETGKFQNDDTNMIIERMQNWGIIDKVSYDTYRRKK
jgi:DNA-binding transcriptional ArsR family regulator